MYLKPSMDINRQYVLNCYPNAHFLNGFIYDGTHKLTGTRWDMIGNEAEYYAWLWAADAIGAEMLRKLEQ